MRLDLSNCDKPRDELVEVVRQWVVGKNADLERKIIVGNLIDGKRYEPLAEELGISVSTVQRAVKKHQRRVTEHF